MGTVQAKNIPLLDIHELTAGKLVALLTRTQARDLFDCQHLFETANFDREILRIVFVVYGGMSRLDWRNASAADITYNAGGLAKLLLPTLRIADISTQNKPDDFGRKLLADCQAGLALVLPLEKNEIAFLDLLLEQGVIDPRLLTADKHLQQRIQSQPLLEWKAQNVRKYKGMVEE